MNTCEFRLNVVVNGSAVIVHTFIKADNMYQAQQLALAQCGIGGSILFGPYPVD